MLISNVIIVFLILYQVLMHLRVVVAEGASYNTCPRLILSDDFDAPAVDMETWSFQNGDGCAEDLCGWGNNELQWYQQENTRVSNGRLIIEANYDAQAERYTSSKLITKNKADFGPIGRVEARIKLPSGGKGLWPAFWMLPTNEVFGTWARSGEIDIMENIGSDPYTISGAMHYADLWPRNKYVLRSVSLPREYNQKFSDSYHIFSIEREEKVVRWLLDDVVYFTKTEQDIAPDLWPFDEEFFLVLNLAIGGNWPGSPDQATKFPTQMEVDYVRVWQGSLPSFAGTRVVGYQQSGVTYSILNRDFLPEDGGTTTYTWYVEARDAQIVSMSNGNSTVSINFGATSGRVAVSVSNSLCGFQRTYEMYVAVRGQEAHHLSILNFDHGRLGASKSKGVTYCCSSGTYANNVPSPKDNAAATTTTTTRDGINPPTHCGQYQRNGNDRWDWLVFTFASSGIMGDTSQYINAKKIIYLDLYTDTAPIGTEIILTLEDNTRSQRGYPHGRHSRFRAYTTTQRKWERITFQYLDRPDPAVPDNNSITSVVLQFGYDTLTSDVFYIGNIDSYTTTVDSSSSVSNSNNDAFTDLPSLSESYSSTFLAPYATHNLLRQPDYLESDSQDAPLPPLPDDSDCNANWASKWLCWLIDNFPSTSFSN